MTDRPILFSAPMVRALLDGTKTQTRRILKPQPRLFEIDERGTPCQVGIMHIAGDAVNSLWLGSPQSGVLPGQKVRFAVGDRLWVKETWSHTGTGVWQIADIHNAMNGNIIYRATDDRPGVGWFPSIFMYRKLSRLTLTVTDVRVERLQDISEADAVAEGLQHRMDWMPQYRGSDSLPWRSEFPRDAYHDLWNSINGDGAWEQNPWVVALTFDVRKGNIDR